MLIICWLALKKDFIYCFPCFDLSFQRKREQEQLFYFKHKGAHFHRLLQAKNRHFTANCSTYCVILSKPL